MFNYTIKKNFNNLGINSIFLVRLPKFCFKMNYCYCKTRYGNVHILIFSKKILRMYATQKKKIFLKFKRSDLLFNYTQVSFS